MCFSGAGHSELIIGGVFTQAQNVCDVTMKSLNFENVIKLAPWDNDRAM